MTLARVAPSRAVAETGVIAVLRARHADEYPAVIAALVAGGIASIELTLSTAGVFERMPRLREQFGDEAEIGIGTITGIDDARRAVDSGARYLVTPTRSAEISEYARSLGIPFYPGGLTPTELHSNWRDGATAVKVFPASVVGPGYIAQLRGPFPDIAVVPSGGVGLDDVVAWVRAGALAVSLGGPLLKDAFSGGDLGALTERARATVRAVAEARSR